MKALPTNYKNIIFRSRTEARWALFFDLMNIKWDYENEGYLLNSNNCYLPDFEITLPNGNEYYIEVKHENFDKFENHELVEKYKTLSNASSKDLIILHGNPRCRPYDVISHKTKNGGMLGFFQDYEPFFRICDEYWYSYVKFNTYNGAPELSWNMTDREISKSFGKKYLDALSKVNAEKFGVR